MNKALLYEPIRKLFAELTVLDGLHHQLEGALRDKANESREKLKDKSDNFPLMGGRSWLLVNDLTEWTKSGWMEPFGVGTFGTFDEQYVETMETLLQRMNLWTVAQAYERFTTFLKDTVAAQLTLSPSCRDRTFKADIPAGVTEEQELALWRVSTEKPKWPQRMRNKNEILLAWLRGYARTLYDSDVQNTRGMDMRVWFYVWAEVRHVAVHNDGVMPRRLYHRFNGIHAEYLFKKFSHEQDEQGRAIFKVKTKQADDCIQIAAEYAFTIFKAQATALEVDWQEVKSNPLGK